MLKAKSSLPLARGSASSSPLAGSSAAKCRGSSLPQTLPSGSAATVGAAGDSVPTARSSSFAGGEQDLAEINERVD